MSTTALSRKDRRVKIAKAAKIYGIKGPESLDLHEAYNALARGEVGTAVQLAHPITQSHPANPHGWVVMGGAALAQREGKTAQTFFGQAAIYRPNDPVVLGGMAKAHVLEAEVEEAVAMAPRAFAAGSEDVGLAGLYLDLMVQFGRRLAAADILAPMAERLNDAGLCHRLGDLLVDAEEPGKAARWYEKAYRLDPQPEPHRIGQLRGLLAKCRFDEAEPLARDLVATATDRDAAVGLLLLLLRVTGRADEAAALIDSNEFATPEGFAHAKGVMANILQDRGDYEAAADTYVEAMHVTGQAGNIAKAYGVFLFRDGDYATGQPHFAERFPAQQRARIPLDNAAPENLSHLDRVVLMSEQGVGDQLALLPLLRLAPLAQGAEVIFVADGRFGPLLEGNLLGVSHRDKTEFLSTPQQLHPNELVYLGDLSRYLDGADPAARQGAYLQPDAARVAALKQKYQALANGKPVIGMAWNSASLIGHLRSIPLEHLVTALPDGALVVNLQYGAVAKDIAAAQAARPDLQFVTDDTVDQMADLAGFAAQIAALDHVVTIDNTTAHVCGALGHPDAHVMIPAGAECMWYWGRTDRRDPWYGAATLHRQAAAGDWAAPLAELRADLEK